MTIAATLAGAARMIGLPPPERDVRFTGVSTDTRNLPAGALFVALRGPTHDGHDHLDKAVAAGATAALVSRPGAAPLPVLRVDDTRAALGQLAGAWRRRFEIPVAGITGSNGKTTTKEMLAAVCTRAGATHATAGNLNNDIGVPLTLLALDPSHRYAVVEMGANAPGEIDYLTALARPTVGMVTNAAAAHLEGFGTLRGVARAKGELYARLPGDAIAVINDDDAAAPLWRELAAGRRRVLFGTGRGCALRLLPETVTTALDDAGFTTRLVVEVAGEPLELVLALAGRHNAANALAAAAAAHALEIDSAVIRRGLAAVRPVAGRLQYRQGRAGARLIDDSYNANPGSLQAALEVLGGLEGERWLVLGDMAELGDEAAAWHADVAGAARRAGVERVFAIGSLSRGTVSAFGSGGRHFEDHDALVEAVAAALHADAVLLVKGSRAMGMERVVKALSAASAESGAAEAGGGR